MKASAVFHALAFSGFVAAAPHGNAGAINVPITPNPSHFINKTFDYVIAGGGLTGLTVASRLTEDPRISVLVVEGGHAAHDDPRVYDVRTYGEAFNSDLDWNLTSTPVESQNGTELLLVAGRMLGGSGCLNGASWTKGASSQYDILPILTGDDSWGWEAFNEYMLEAENFWDPTAEQVEKGAQFEADFHGAGGPVEVSFAAGLFGSIQLPAVDASTQVWDNLTRIEDAAAGEPNGVTIIPNMVHSDDFQNRSSPFTAYAWHQQEIRSNFNILTGHRVIEVVWEDDTTTVATGVYFQASRDAEVLYAGAHREVLLAAGSLQSPQILELSGVGDPDVLEAAGVAVKRVSLGVGKHMQEQTKNSLFYNPVSTEWGGSGPPASIAFPNVHQMLGDNSSAVYNWIMEGLPAHAEQLVAQGDAVNATATLAVLEAQVNNLWLDNAPAAEIFYTITTSTEQVGADIWNLIVLARGHAHIQTNSSWDHPTVEPRYFGHPFDLLIQTLATLQTREAYQASPLADMVTEEMFPGFDQIAQGDEYAAWEDFVQETFTSVWHYIATLAMMKEELGGVVDSTLKIYGIENVRAIDASVLPIQLSAHLSSSLYGIAEKAADMIQQDQQFHETYSRVY